MFAARPVGSPAAGLTAITSGSLRTPLWVTALWKSICTSGGYGEGRREALFTLTTLANARPGGKQGLLLPETTAPELPAFSQDELLHLDLGFTGVTASGRDLLDGQRSHLRDLGCVPMTGLKHGASVWIAGTVVSRQKPPPSFPHQCFRYDQTK